MTGRRACFLRRLDLDLRNTPVAIRATPAITGPPIRNPRNARSARLSTIALLASPGSRKTLTAWADRYPGTSSE